MSKDYSRRKFLENVALGSAAGVSLPLLKGFAAEESTALPHRVLGGTGEKVTILAFGCGSRFLMYQEEDQALAALHRAFELGIRYFDTAYAYGDGKSEERVGKLMAERRKEVFLATKIPDRNRDGFMSRLEGSLKRLKTDYVDLVHIHSLGHADDLAKLEAPDGALRGLLEAREQKMARFVGITSHTDGAVLAQAIERHDLNCTQMALNAARNGQFEELALPAARKKNLGVIAMKVCGREFLVGTEANKSDFDSLLRYSMGLPVAAAVVGMPHLEMIEHNTTLARAFTPLGAGEIDRLRERVAPLREPLAKYLIGHLDGPTDCGHLFWA